MQYIQELILDENNVAFHPTMGNSYQLNATAKDIIHLLKVHKTKEEIIEELAERYGVAKKELYIDVNDFFNKLKIYGLLS